MVYPATMESLSPKFQKSRSNGLAIVPIWRHEFSGHSSAIFVIHRKSAPYIYLESVCQGDNVEPIKTPKIECPWTYKGSWGCPWIYRGSFVLSMVIIMRRIIWVPLGQEWRPHQWSKEPTAFHRNKAHEARCIYGNLYPHVLTAFIHVPTYITMSRLMTPDIPMSWLYAYTVTIYIPMSLLYSYTVTPYTYTHVVVVFIHRQPLYSHFMTVLIHSYTFSPHAIIVLIYSQHLYPHVITIFIHIHP